METIIDPKYGDGLVAANIRTIKDFGSLQYKGCELILDPQLGDGVLAVNPRTYEQIKGEDLLEPLGSHKKENEGLDKDKELEPSQKLTENQLYELIKKEQVALLESYGLSRKEIRKLRLEKNRVEKLLELQGE